jgi:hypothetical protein
VYDVKFLDPEDLSESIHNVVLSGESLYITPNPVIVNDLPSPVYNKVQANNRIESNDYPGEVYSNIL